MFIVIGRPVDVGPRMVDVTPAVKTFDLVPDTPAEHAIVQAIGAQGWTIVHDCLDKSEVAVAKGKYHRIVKWNSLREHIS